jgi:hypothetical protein
MTAQLFGGIEAEGALMVKERTSLRNVAAAVGVGWGREATSQSVSCGPGPQVYQLAEGRGFVCPACL